MTRKNKDWISRVIDDIQLKSKIFNPKANMHGNRMEEDRFLNDCRYQYISKHEEARQVYK